MIAHGVSKEKTSQTTRLIVTLGDGKFALREGASYAYVYLRVCQGWAQAVQFRSVEHNRELVRGRAETDLRERFLNGCHVGISGKDARYRLYVDGQKIVDIPRGMPSDEEIKNNAFFYPWFEKR